MNKIQFEELLKPLIAIYDEIELDLIRNILSRIDNYDDISGSLDWYLNKLSELGTFDKENLALLKKNKKKIKEILLDILKQAANNRNDFDRLDSFYQQGLLNINPVSIYNNVSINNLISEATSDTNNIIDLINTKAIEGTKEEYKNILNKAYLETSTGVYTYSESIRRAIKEMADNGIQIVHYDSGRKVSIESAVRRDIITRTNKLVGSVELQLAKDLGTNLVYVDQHLGARIRTKYTKHDYEAHAEWQGKKYMIDGSSEEYPNLYEATGYEKMLGLKGINCYHDMRPTWEWEEIPDVIDEVENAIEYEKLQRKRALERKSRTIKRRKEIAKFNKDKDELKKLNAKQKAFNEEYDTWLEKNGLTRDYSREYVNKYINSQQQTSNSKEELPYEDVTEQLKNMQGNPNPQERRLNYSIDSDGNKHYDYFFEDDKKIIEEIKYQKKLEELTGYKVYLNPKTHSDGYKSPDFWIEDINELWDLKGIDGNSKNVIDNILHNASEKFQTPNIILKQRKTTYEIDYLKEKLKNIFEKKQRQKIKQVILFDKNDNIIVYYKR